MKHVLVRITATLIILAGAASLARVAMIVADDEYLTHNDFTQDYVSARSWFEGSDPYAETGGLIDRHLGEKELFYAVHAPVQRNPHSPFGILLAAPFANLNYELARVLWLIVGAVAIAMAVALTARTLGADRRWTVVMGMAAFLVPVVRMDLIYGQSDPLLFLAIVLAWVTARHRPDSWIVGALLGAGAALKVFPLLFLLPLLRLRHVRSATVLVATTAGVLVVSGFTLGMEHTVYWLTDVSPANTAFWLAAPQNASLASLPARWLTENPWRLSGPELVGLARVLSLLATALCLGLLVRSKPRLSAEPILSALPLMLLATPLAWHVYGMLLIPLFMVIVSRTVGTHQPLRPWLYLSMAFVLFGVHGALTSSLTLETPLLALGYSLPMIGIVGVAMGDRLGSPLKRTDAPSTQAVVVLEVAEPAAEPVH
jgi:hypothetical protein